MIASWLFPALLSALMLGLYDVCKKHAVRDNAVMPVLFCATASGSLLYVLLVLCSGTLGAAVRCSGEHFALIAIKSLLVSGSWILVYYAMRELPISLAAPVRSSAPLWTALGGILILGEIPTLIQAAGMVTVLAGYGIFSFLGSKEGFSLRSRGMILIIAGTLLGACSALFDKYLLSVRMVDRQVLQFYFSVDLVVLLGAGYLVRCLCGKPHQMEWRWSVPVTGMLLVIADYIYFYVLSMENAPISLVSLVRRSGCAVSFAVGVWVFRDRNVKRKAWALALLFAGIILIAIGKKS